jgi:ABC-type Fe3+-hydroxamate transport system substrate-binding protein
MASTRTFVDAVGRRVQIPQNPQRLVSLVPSITETLFCFGWGPQVVGITEYCTEPATEVGRKATIGGTKNPDVGKILSLAPQLVFAVAEENRRDDVEQLHAAGIPVYVFAPCSVREGIGLLWRLAAILDCQSTVALLLRDIEHTYTETQALVATRPSLRVFCPIWKEPYMTIAAGTYMHDMLRVCGGVNIFAQRQRRFPLAADLGQQPEAPGERYVSRDRRYPRIALEEMAARRPDMILLPDEPYVFRPTDIADFAPFRDVPAVRNGRILLIDGKLLSWYGARLGRSLQTLCELLAP